MLGGGPWRFHGHGARSRATILPGQRYQILHVLPDDFLRHLPAKIPNQQTYTTIFQERKSVKILTLATIEGSQCVYTVILGPRTRHRTDARAPGDGWQAQTDSLSWKVPQVSFISRESAESHRKTEPPPDSAQTLEGQSARSFSLGGRKDLLFLFNDHCSPQLPSKDWGKLDDGQK